VIVMDEDQFRVFCHLTLGLHAPYPYMPPPGFDLYSELSLMAEEARYWFEERLDAFSYSFRERRRKKVEPVEKTTETPTASEYVFVGK